ncbi:MAG: Nif11-like leader peptide family RiPP precursor [Oscillospiraceae bacterium]|nr:Nif11-like leader peptide family RiPP precursor [Oscillospiraceae bacterium]
MKSFQQFYSEIMSNPEMKDKFFSLKPEEAEAFAKDHGCDASLEEMEAYMNAQQPYTGELSDDALEQVAGGVTQYVDGTYFEFTGNYSNPDDYNRMYRCPECGRLVHWGSWSRWYCDHCNASWYFTDNLKLNMDSGMWRVVSNAEVQQRRKGTTMVKG